MKIKNFILGLGILIVFGLVLWQGIEAFYPTPEYNDFCTANSFGTYPVKADGTLSGTCNFSRALQGQQDQCYAQEGQPIFEYDDQGCAVSLKECNYCNKQYEEALDAHAKIAFIISIIIAVIIFVIGYFLLSTEPVGSALIASGIWSIFWGSAINWRNFSSIWRFLLLLIALIGLIWFTLRLNRKQKKPWQFWKR